MDSFELNKILGAFLFTCLCLLALNIGAEAVFHPEKPAKPGYDVVVTEHPAGGEGAKPEAEQPIAQLLANADVKKGESSAKKCAACHTFGKGEPNRVGPNLYGVVGRPKGTEGGFAYSDAMKKKGGNWSIDDLNEFLSGPQKYVPGTKMSFAGLPRGTERADVIAYLNSKSDNPQPLPKAEAGAAPKPAADAGGAAKPAEGGAAKPAADAGNSAKPADAGTPNAAAPKPAEAPAGQKK
jgi:cytochrome c